MQKWCQSFNIRTVKIFKRVINWFTVHPSGTDILVTLTFAGLALLNLYVNWGTATQLSSLFAILLTLLVIFPLVVRRRYPLGVLAFMTLAIIAFRAFSIPESSFTVYALFVFQHPVVLPQGLRVPHPQGQRPVVWKGLYY